MKLFLLIILFAGSQALAQAVDMRAFSRQRGYKAYRKEQVATSTTVRSYPVRERTELSSSADGGGDLSFPELVSADSGDVKKLRQTGIKIFQEKDEDKVMNFVVENPEFKKLNKKRQQDLLNRIKYEKDQGG